MICVVTKKPTKDVVVTRFLVKRCWLYLKSLGFKILMLCWLYWLSLLRFVLLVSSPWLFLRISRSAEKQVWYSTGREMEKRSTGLTWSSRKVCEVSWNLTWLQNSYVFLEFIAALSMTHLADSRIPSSIWQLIKDNLSQQQQQCRVVLHEAYEATFPNMSKCPMNKIYRLYSWCDTSDQLQLF